MKKLSLKVWTLLGLCGLLCAGLVFSGWFYSAHALPRTSIAGQSFSSSSRAQVNEALKHRVESAQVTLQLGDTTQQASLEDLGITVDIPATVDAAFSENSGLLSRFLGIFRSRSITPVVQLDNSQLSRFGASLAQRVGTPVSDAALSPKEDGSGFTVVPSHEGIALNAADLAKVQQDVAQDLGSSPRTINVEVREPKINTQRAEEALTQAQSLIAPSVTITDGIDDFTASKADKMKWVKVSAEGDRAAVLDSDALSAWVNNLAQSTNVESEKGIQGVNSRGDVVGVLKAGTVGYRANNTQAVVSGITDALNNGKSYSGDFDYDKIQPEYDRQDIPDGYGDDVYQASAGEKWIDIDLSKNTVSAYEGRTIVHGPTPMVPGAPNTPTVTGKFHVYLQYASQTMEGENADGTNYRTEGVPWVTYFYAGYALHGAPWRSSFGWSGYGGSHGCVNMPVDGAHWIYDWADNGTVVISHY